MAKQDCKHRVLHLGKVGLVQVTDPQLFWIAQADLGHTPLLVLA